MPDPQFKCPKCGAAAVVRSSCSGWTCYFCDCSNEEQWITWAKINKLEKKVEP
jgi:hypothetical protein